MNVNIPEMRNLVFYFLFFTFHFANAQEFGGEPSSLQWKQVNTDTVRIIFPQGLDSIAKRIAAITSKEQQQYSSTIGNKLHKVSIVLHSQSIFSNAFVALGPWRSEFFLTPQQNAFELGSISWTDLLSVHEYRHVEQYSNFNVGGSHVMRILFGDNGQALANAAAIPDWFFEGDAVYNETILSEQGRGRLPLFLNGYKSLYLQNRQYNYMKLRNGSLKDYVPDHYPLGYMLVAYGREKYGDDFWKDVTQDAAKFHSLFYPMQNAVERYAHVSFDEFVHNTFDYYQQQWKGEAVSNFQLLDSTEKNNVADEKYPYTTGDGSLIMLHKSYRDIPKLILRHADGNIEQIGVQDITDDDYFSYNNGKIVYASFKPDVRWGNREYSEIRLLDVKTKKEKRITSKTRYFSPDISHDRKMIAVIELAADGSSKLLLLHADGGLIREAEGHEGHVFSYPKFSSDDKFVLVCDRNEEGRMGILKEKVEGGNLNEVVPYENRIIGFPVVQGDTLFYSCSNNGRDEIWAYINSENKNYRIASSAKGLYHGTLSKGKLIVSAFTADGYRLASLQPEWQQVNNSDTLKPLYVSKPFQKEGNNLLSNISQRDFAVTKYPKAFHPFNFHSWNPYFSDPDYSFILYGQNVLNTFQSELYYTYNRDEHFHKVGYTGIYGGWYVQPVLDINQTWNRTKFLNADTSLRWNETKLAAGFQLPLNLTGGKMYRNLNINATYHLASVQWEGFAKQLLNNSNFGYVQFHVDYSQYIQQSVQHIYPEFGQSFLLQYRRGSTAHQFLASSYLYFPGLYKTHNLVFNIAYQLRDTSGKYYFENDFPFSRGYTAVDYPRLWKAGVNYHFPLCYPDWGFGNIVYCLRIRANLFYDFTQAKSLRTGNHYNFASAGTEIFFDTKWWNQQFISFGMRYSRLLNLDFKGLNANQWEIVLPVNL
ncbi:MAG: hypothetical protein ABJA79_05705 [Parafilimonas sp.]